MKANYKAVVAALLMVVLIGPLGHAQEEDGGQSSSSKRRKYTYGEDIVVQGKIAKPQVQFIISREKGTSEEALELKESFVPKILKALETPPF